MRPCRGKAMIIPLSSDEVDKHERGLSQAACMRLHQALGASMMSSLDDNDNTFIKRQYG